MHLRLLCPLLAFCITLPVSAQIPPELVKAERTKLLAEVSSVPKTGAPGPVAIWGNMAFPLLAAADGREANELAVAAAAGYGKGRIILFGHNSYLDGAAGGDHAKLLQNCIRWAGNREKPKTGLRGIGSSAFFDQAGLSA
ncbi:MAG TPA: hypothetical protein VGE29_09840, partial [Prosthecobacter sp.]